MKRIVKKEGTQVIRGAGVIPIVEQFQQVKKMQQQWAEKEKELKARLMTILEEQGELDDKDNLWFPLPEEVNGVVSIKREIRRTQIFNEGLAETELKKLGLWDECSYTVEVIDEDVVLAKGFTKEISEELMGKLYEEKVTYALVMKK